MAYRSKSNRSKTQAPPSSPHTLLRVLGVLACPILLAFRLPGFTLLMILFLAARFTARRPQLSGKGLDGRPAPEGTGERRMEASYRTASRWMDGGLTPTRPDAVACLIPAILAYAWITWDATGVTPYLIGLLDGVCCWLACMSQLNVLRDMTRTVDGLDSHMRRPRTKWAKTKVGPMLIGMGVSLIPGLMLTLLLFRFWPIPLALACGVTVAYLPLWRADRKRFDLDYESRRTIGRWLASIGKPTVKTLPYHVTGTKVGADGSRLFLLHVANAVEWVDEGTRKSFTPPAQQDGMRVAFAYDGADRTRVSVAIIPIECPPAADLIADETSVTARLQEDESRMGAMYGAYAGRIVQVKTVATRNGRPAVLSFDIDGTNADWRMISRDWLKGAESGAFGDWMDGSGLTVTPDPDGHGWLSLDTEWEKYEWDANMMKPLMGSTLTDPNHHPDPVRYMRLIGLDKDLKATFTAGLDAARLPAPERIFHDSTYRVRNPYGWDITVYAVTIPKGRSIGDYMKPDLRGAFKESRIADLMPWLENGRPRMRLMQFVHAPDNDRNTRIPDGLDVLYGRSPADVMVARTIISRAFSRMLTHPATVGEPQQLCVNRRSMWRVPIRLEEGTTVADVRRRVEGLKGLMGATGLFWRWRDASHAILWAGDPSDDPADWMDPRDRLELLRLRLDEAWAVSKATGADGKPVTTLSVEDGPGPLTTVGFGMPAGLGVDGALLKLDAFRATSGYPYVRRTPGKAPLTLLLGRADPLPDSVMADWRMMADRTMGTSLPFAVGDDGRTVTYDPHDTPHLLITGQTMSGKTSAAVTLTNAALLRGWTVMIGDPTKSGNDFLPVKDKLSGFATGLAACAAMLKWADMEGRRRLELQKQHGVENMDGLPESVKPPRILIFLDEFVSLLELSKGNMRPTGDPDVDNMIIMDKWNDMVKRSIGASVSHILTQHRSQGITLILGSQMLKTASMDALPDAGLAKNQLGRLFIGAGSTAGNLSQRNEMEGNRLIAQCMESGGMPKGRGLYERMGRNVQLVQCWWCGKPDMIEEHMRPVPDVTPIDWSEYVPKPPQLVGVMEPEKPESEPERVETVDATDGDEWVID
ncbi:type IV secretory system conjugative DNA transfer family protein [Bifidobacterium felsineum]|uniref:type IV secretory system conjugative DNA transfer family protein n=1 Tax=Bifidobacterium felsineum TaxID=2045440 RepID=UPI001BDC4603|nr:type IV secretory system conjugative DNA transfer family protein [Bifidobacterium felsineum]MBT1164567.1 cell division protein FtsK [Bifidobacterium felsineum]